MANMHVANQSALIFVTVFDCFTDENKYVNWHFYFHLQA